MSSAHAKNQFKDKNQFAAEEDARKATQVTQISTNQDQAKQIITKEPKLRWTVYKWIWKETSQDSDQEKSEEVKIKSKIQESYEWRFSRLSLMKPKTRTRRFDQVDEKKGKMPFEAKEFSKDQENIREEMKPLWKKVLESWRTLQRIDIISRYLEKTA